MKAFAKWGALTLAIGALVLSVGSVEAGGKTLKVCADPNNPPFSVKDGSGYENKIAELFASELGQTLEYTWFPQRLGFIRNTLKAKLPDTEEYKCDVVMGVPAGFEMAATTKPYYRSTYVLVYKKSGPLQGIKAPADIDKLARETKTKLRIAMFDGAPGTTWLLNHGLIGQGCDFRADRGGVGDPGQGDVGQGLQRLDAHEGGIEIEDIGGRLSHAGTLADLRSCSNSWRRLTENTVQSV